jgi:hypothetical protein
MLTNNNSFRSAKSVEGGGESIIYLLSKKGLSIRLKRKGELIMGEINHVILDFRHLSVETDTIINQSYPNVPLTVVSTKGPFCICSTWKKYCKDALDEKKNREGTFAFDSGLLPIIGHLREVNVPFSFLHARPSDFHPLLLSYFDKKEREAFFLSPHHPEGVAPICSTASEVTCPTKRMVNELKVKPSSTLAIVGMLKNAKVATDAGVSTWFVGADAGGLHKSVRRLGVCNFFEPHEWPYVLERLRNLVAPDRSADTDYPYTVVQRRFFTDRYQMH